MWDGPRNHTSLFGGDSPRAELAAGSRANPQMARRFGEDPQVARRISPAPASRKYGNVASRVFQNGLIDAAVSTGEGVRRRNVAMKPVARFVLVVGLAVLALLALNVVPVRAPGPGVDYIIIQRDPSANGTWVLNGTYLIGDNDTFYSVGYNTTSGWIGPVRSYWWSDNLNSG